jgi:hypothetical protein
MANTKELPVFNPQQYRGLRFERTASAAFKDASYADPIEGPEEGPGLLISPMFWIGGILAVACWTGIWMAIAFILENI